MIQSKRGNRSHPSPWVTTTAALALCALLVLAWYFARTPIRNAAKIQPGDTSAVVHGLLGSPDRTFDTVHEVQASYRSYVFKDQSRRTLAELPSVDNRAECFEFGSAVHIVYYDEDGVTEVYWGGT